MKSKYSALFLLLIILINMHNVQAKDFNSLQNGSKENVRSLFLGVGAGFPEIVSISLGYQLNKRLSFTIKFSDYYDGHGGDWNFGIPIYGLRVSYFFDETFLRINNLSTGMGFSTSGPDKYNYMFEVAFGFESNLQRVIRLYYAAGVSLLIPSSYKVFLTPSLKFGIIINY